MVTFMVVVVAAFLVGAMVGAWIVMDLSQASGSVVGRGSRGGRVWGHPFPCRSPHPALPSDKRKEPQ